MAQIIPQMKRGESVNGKNIFFFFALFFLFAVLGVYFIIGYFQSKALENLSQINQAIAETQSSENKDAKKRVEKAKEKIDTFSLLINKHQEATKVFSLLEKDIHPNVYFFSFSADTEASTIIVSGSAKTFQSLGQQIFIFEADPVIKEVSLSGVSITSTGGIRFTFNIMYSPKYTLMRF